MNVVRLGVVLVGVAVCSARAAGQVTTVVVPDAPSCAKCTIVTKPVVTLGAVDGPGSLSTQPSSVRVDARGRYWLTQDDELPMVFDASGKFVQAIGRKGESPGEFLGASSTLPLKDSVLVFDGATSRATLVGADLRPGRTISVPRRLWPGTIVTWPSLAVMSNGARDRHVPASPLVRVTFLPTEVQVLGFFASERLGLDVMLPQASMQVIAEARSGRVWTADGSYRYRLSQWTVAGTLERSLERKPDWFANPAFGSARSAAAPQTRAIAEDASGLLWVFVNVARPEWRDGMPKAGPGTHEVSMRQISFDKMYRTNIEVIDPRTARIVARREMEDFVIAALPNGRAAVYSVDEQGTPRVSIVQVALIGR
jgi:hypothetical protein